MSDNKKIVTFPHIRRPNGEVYTLVVPEPFIQPGLSGELWRPKNIEEIEARVRQRVERFKRSTQ